MLGSISHSFARWANVSFVCCLMIFDKHHHILANVVCIFMLNSRMCDTHFSEGLANGRLEYCFFLFQPASELFPPWTRAKRSCDSDREIKRCVGDIGRVSWKFEYFHVVHENEISFYAGDIFFGSIQVWNRKSSTHFLSQQQRDCVLIHKFFNERARPLTAIIKVIWLISHFNIFFFFRRNSSLFMT